MTLNNSVLCGYPPILCFKITSAGFKSLSVKFKMLDLPVLDGDDPVLKVVDPVLVQVGLPAESFLPITAIHCAVRPHLRDFSFTFKEKSNNRPDHIP